MPSRETYEHGRDKHVAFFVSSKHMFVHKRNVMEQPQRQQQFLWAFIQVSSQLLFLFTQEIKGVFAPQDDFAAQYHALS